MQGYYDRIIALAADVRSTRSTHQSWMCCDWPATSCCPCVSPSTRPSTSPCNWPRPWGRIRQSVSSTVCCARSPEPMPRPGVSGCSPRRTPVRRRSRWSTRIRSGSRGRSGRSWSRRDARVSSSSSWSPTTSLRGCPSPRCRDTRPWTNSMPTPVSTHRSALFWTAATRSKLAAVREGRARVQDEGSALAALILSRARPISAGEQWLDLCAGPGGKAALLAAEARGGGATLTANELVPARAELVRKALAVFEKPPRSGSSTERLSARRTLHSSTGYCWMPPAQGRCPAPSTRGALAQAASDVAGLGALQAALLASGLAALKPGGLLAYVTCSPHAAETKAIVASALKGAGGGETGPPAVLQSLVRESLDLPEASHTCSSGRTATAPTPCSCSS